MSQVAQQHAGAVDAPGVGWRAIRPWMLGLLAALLLVGVWARLDVWRDILLIVQRDPEASHIVLVPPVFAWILWTYRYRFRGYVVRWPLAGVAITLLGWGLSTYGDVRAYSVFWHFGAVMVLAGIAVSVLGVELVRRFWPAFVVLVFLLPVPGSLRQPMALFLQNISAQWVAAILSLHGVDIVRTGNVLVINGREVGIAEACNGMRMMMMLFLVCYTFVFIHPLRPWVRIMLLALAPLFALVTNIIRLIPTVIVYGRASLSTAEAFHNYLGWVMIVVSYALLVGFLWLMRWLLIPVDDERELLARRRVR